MRNWAENTDIRKYRKLKTGKRWEIQCNNIQDFAKNDWKHRASIDKSKRDNNTQVEVIRIWWVQAKDYGKCSPWCDKAGGRSALWWRSWALDHSVPIIMNCSSHNPLSALILWSMFLCSLRIPCFLLCCTSRFYFVSCLVYWTVCMDFDPCLADYGLPYNKTALGSTFCLYAVTHSSWWLW